MFVRVCVWVFSHTNIGIFNFVSNGCTLSVPLHLYLYLFGSRISPSNRVEIYVVALSVAKAKLQAQSCKGLVPVVLPTSLVALSSPPPRGCQALLLFDSSTASLWLSLRSLSLSLSVPVLPFCRSHETRSCTAHCLVAPPRLASIGSLLIEQSPSIGDAYRVSSHVSMCLCTGYRQTIVPGTTSECLLDSHSFSLSRPSSLYRALVRHIAVCTLWIIILSFRPTYIQYIF